MPRLAALAHRLPAFLVFFWLMVFPSLMVLRVNAQPNAQPNYLPDSLKRELGRAPDLTGRAFWADKLARYYFTTDSALSESYSRQAVEAAEMSRDRMVMIKTYLHTGSKFLQIGGLSDNENMNKAMDNFHRAEQIARDDRLDAGLVYSDCQLAQAYQLEGDNKQALTYSNQAVTTAAETGDDSLQVLAYSALGDTYDGMNEKLLAFRNYLKALDVAEESKADDLQSSAAQNMLGFYYGINEYDKAIDYGMKTIEFDRKTGQGGQLAQDYNELGEMFGRKKSYDLALEMFERSIAVCDSLHLYTNKFNSYFAIMGMYFSRNQFKEGIDYLNSHPEMLKSRDQAGYRIFIDEVYGQAYSEMGRFDSAAWYFNNTQPLLASMGETAAKAQFYDKAGQFYWKKGDIAGAIAYYQKERLLGLAIGDIRVLRDCGLDLDSLFVLKGDFRSAYQYHLEYVHYGDSLRSLARATDLLKLEVDNDNRRRERQAREEEQDRERRHNVQYMGFTVGLVVLFISLVMMGWLAVPASVIRGLGFLSFIFLFEFIILLTDKQIAELTHDEPWKVLLIKIALAAVLLPLHHWTEHKVIHFLSTRKRFKGERRVKKEVVVSN
jgi:tetratricopeptide (TPR) repeat protein